MYQSREFKMHFHFQVQNVMKIILRLLIVYVFSFPKWCLVVFLTLTENLFTWVNCSASIFSKLILILVSHSVHFSRHKWDLVGIIVMRKKIIVFLKIPKIENCFDRFCKQFIIFFFSFLELFWRSVGNMKLLLWVLKKTEYLHHLWYLSHNRTFELRSKKIRDAV